MPQKCPQCSRVNPAVALYCYHDGTSLAGDGARLGPVHVGSQPFPTAFVLPTGRGCRNFDQLALACQEDVPAALEALQQGDLASFLGSLGRADLARAAREAARAPNRVRGLDGLLAALPSKVLEPPKLYVEPTVVNLGELRVGEDRKLSLRLVNRGMRLLYGSVVCKDSVWLSLGDVAGTHQKLFQFAHELTLPLHVQGKLLSASSKPQEARLVIESNGGDVTVVVRATVPVKPFPNGVLAGAVSPRQIAEKARDHPREAAVFFEDGSVARWYRENGWSYPVKGAFSSGLGAIQQYFEAHGLARPPKVELTPPEVLLTGSVGEALRGQLEVRTLEERAVYALAGSDQPWLKIECPPPKGRLAQVWLIVPAVPDQPGATLQARVTVQANGNQRFVVPVTLAIGGRRTTAVPPPARAVSTVHDAPPMAIPVAAPPVPTAIPVGIPITAPLPAAVPVNGATGPATEATTAAARTRWHRHFIPASLLAVVLLGLFLRDTLFTGGPRPGDDETALLDQVPRLILRMHDRPDPPKDAQGRPGVFSYPTMRFGLVTHDLKNAQRPSRLTYDEFGRSNNTCVRVDGNDYLFGEQPGRWKAFRAGLGKDPRGREIDGCRSVWVLEQSNVSVTQTVEIVQGQTSRLLDTCLIRYRVENHDRNSHRVGLRLLLDTYIGENDGVPFTLPGSQALCDTLHDFASPGDVPDFIQALERGDLADPGTVANVQLRLGGRLEAPARVTLGAWPDRDLLKQPQISARYGDAINGHMTLWDVPLLPIKSIQSVNFRASADSAVVLYWDERELASGASREVGFAYGLGDVTTSAGGRLALTVGGALVRGGEFSVTAYVTNPTPGQRLALHLPDGLRLKDDAPEQIVPSVPAGAARPISTITWKVQALKTGQHDLKVTSSAGGEQSQRVAIRQRSIFD